MYLNIYKVNELIKSLNFLKENDALYYGIL